VAQALLPRHVSTFAAERNWSVWGNIYTLHLHINIYKARPANRLSEERADKLIFIAGNKGCANLPGEAREMAMDLLPQEGA
jgi:hypothetical protein